MRMFSIGIAICLISAFALAQDSGNNGQTSESDQSTPEVTTERPMSFWMEKKLDYSKALLESLTKGDFEELAEVSEKMLSLSKLEGFVRRGSVDYRNQLRTFEIANRELIRSANRGSSEGALVAFNQLTASCVSCHVLLREGVE